MKDWFMGSALALSTLATVSVAAAQSLPQLTLEPGWVNPALTTDIIAFRGLPYEVEAYRGAEQLGLNPEFVHDVRAGLELLYLRDYRGTRRHFEGVEEKWPGSAIAPVMDAVVWQALMLENFDFQYERQYETSSRLAREALESAMATPGNEGWEHFLMVGVTGIEAIHTVRREKYVAALSLAFEAMDHVSKSKEASPEFVDLKLADGMYHFWRTVMTEDSALLPDFGDFKEQGLQEMGVVETDGIFLSMPATLSIAFANIEQRQLKQANTNVRRISRSYPDNVINNLVLGQVQTYRRRYDDALETWDRIAVVAPDNKRVRYWRGVTLLRSGNSEAAMTELQTYLESEYLEDWHRAAAHYRLGQALYRQDRYDEAWQAYKEADRIDNHKGARAAMDRMRKRKRDGAIDFSNR
ncbi:MAG: tetratricopeptide (TPR) repeat protein [Myxococcota bacterium]|jgi:tetratricopeptide (TPR) repeat protein